MKVTIDGIDDVLRNLGGIEDQVRSALVRSAQEIGMSIVTDAQGMTPVDTGRLRNSWTMSDVEVVDDGITAVVGTNLEYAPYIEFGTGYAGRNDPYNQQFPVEGLSFTSKKQWAYVDTQGNLRFAHPQPAHAPLRRAIAMEEPRTLSIVQKNLEEELR